MNPGTTTNAMVAADNCRVKNTGGMKELQHAVPISNREIEPIIVVLADLLFGGS